MNNLTNGTHKVLFSCGKLYLDGVQIAGEGINPPKDVVFEFQINKLETLKEEEKSKDISVLEVNVHDSVAARGVGPGQR